MNWQEFVRAYGFRTRAADLAHITGAPAGEIERFRTLDTCNRLPKRLTFTELFQRWHGRAPSNGDWPAPRSSGADSYEWLPPESAILASLVGRKSMDDIATILTTRLQRVTGDPTAKRTRVSVQGQMGHLGLQTGDVVGGLTSAAAGKEIGSLAMVYQAIEKKSLRARKVGRRWVIPYAEWERWKTSRVFPPDGYVPLASIRPKLGIASDSKLCEFAKRGHIPTAMRCNPYGTGLHSTQYGTWYLDGKVAEQLVADRHDGRPMPWHGKPVPENLKATWKTWQAKKHPSGCEACRHIWGEAGAPRTFEDYVQRYPSLDFGAKRHLTHTWDPGLSITALAAESGRSRAHIQQAIDNGQLAVAVVSGNHRISRSEASRWMARHTPTGVRRASWVLARDALSEYKLDEDALIDLIHSRAVPAKLMGANEQLYVGRYALTRLRNQDGFTEAEAAERLDVDIPRLRGLLAGVGWRKASRIPLDTINAIRKRLESSPGFSVEEAAVQVGRSATWIRARIDDGTVRVTRGKWGDRLYLTQPMIERLRKVANVPRKDAHSLEGYVRVGDAAMIAGVCGTTVFSWGDAGEVSRRTTSVGNWYPIEEIKARAREYWRTVRFKRATPPAWLQEELAAGCPASH